MVKKFKAKKHHKKKHHKKKPNGLTILRCPYKPGTQMFPDIYRCKGKTNVTFAVSITGTANNTAYYEVRIAGNNCANGNGPSVNLNRAGYGTYLSNVPSGINYLLGDANLSGSGSGGARPYYSYRVISSMIKATWIPDYSATASTTALIVIPLNNNAVSNGSLNSAVLGTLIEQPYAKVKYYPAYMTSMPKPLINKMNTLKLYGEQFKATFESGQFDCTYTAGPTNTWFWQLSIVTTQGLATSYSIVGSLEIDLWHELEFFNRNTYNSQLPS